ncbi:MAG: TIGR01906 family membrane protein [Anaerolineae bacterium]|nr:TIGR01906 family membrane protein [Anaerolineae bacterium]MDK1080917.1 TIGR01906 family membrane protein [Anaerolineae bacterium]MDK1119407.1 TIGR01906 family membrane protein [Anaerolineae bacterium]
MNTKITTSLSWLTTLLTPLFLLGLGVRILLSPLFYNIEYRMPYFPSDDYGFTLEDRLRHAPYVIDYLLNDADISYLGDLTFKDGNVLFNDRELSHMQDVKILTKAALNIWYILVVLTIGIGTWAWFGKWWQAFRQGLRRGGWLMIGLVVTTGVFGAIAFRQLFTAFHGLFFTGDTWLFRFSDTLIRLFPIQFWQDAFLWAGVISIGGGLILGIFLKPPKSKNE